MKSWLEELLTRLDSKVDRLDSRLDTIDVTLAKHEANLQEHIRRTSIAEENLEMLRSETKVSFKEQAAVIKPLTTHVQRVEGALKLVGLVATLIGVLTGLTSLVSFVGRLL